MMRKPVVTITEEDLLGFSRILYENANCILIRVITVLSTTTERQPPIDWEISTALAKIGYTMKLTYLRALQMLYLCSTVRYCTVHFELWVRQQQTLKAHKPVYEKVFLQYARVVTESTCIATLQYMYPHTIY